MIKQWNKIKIKTTCQSNKQTNPNIWPHVCFWGGRTLLLGLSSASWSTGRSRRVHTGNYRCSQVCLKTSKDLEMKYYYKIFSRTIARLLAQHKKLLLLIPVDDPRLPYLRKILMKSESFICGNPSKSWWLWIVSLLCWVKTKQKQGWCICDKWLVM